MEITAEQFQTLRAGTVAATREVPPPAEKLLCHIGMTTMALCARCQRAKKFYAAVTLLETLERGSNENSVMLERQREQLVRNHFVAANELATLLDNHFTPASPESQSLTRLQIAIETLQKFDEQKTT